MVDGKETDKLEMRRPKVRDVLSAEKNTKGDSAREVWLFAALCGVDVEVIEDLDMMDYTSLQGVYTSFLS